MDLSIIRSASEAYAWRGVYSLYRDFRERGIKNYEKTLKLNPNNACAYNVLWQVICTEKDCAEGTRYLKKAADLERGNNLNQFTS